MRVRPSAGGYTESVSQPECDVAIGELIKKKLLIDVTVARSHDDITRD